MVIGDREWKWGKKKKKKRKKQEKELTKNMRDDNMKTLWKEKGPWKLNNARDPWK